MPEKHNMVYADSHHAEFCPGGQPLDGQRAVLCVQFHIYRLPVHADQGLIRVHLEKSIKSKKNYNNKYIVAGFLNNVSLHSFHQFGYTGVYISNQWPQPENFTCQCLAISKGLSTVYLESNVPSQYYDCLSKLLHRVIVGQIILHLVP